MATYSERGEVLNEGYLRMATDTGIPYDRITPELYTAYKAARYSAAYGMSQTTFAEMMRRNNAGKREQAHWENMSAQEQNRKARRAAINRGRK